jgi:hypothetical protein
LAPFKQSQLLPPNYQCTATTPGAKLWPADGTNCVDTVTGLDSTSAEQGFLIGINGSYQYGLLQDPTSSTHPDPANYCPNSYPSSTHSVTMRGRPINNDVLTCFFTDGSTSIADIAKANYSGGAVLDPSILASPRFFFVPVLKVQPTSGGSNKYAIIDFRPAFITDEQAISTAIKGSKTGTTENGIRIQGQDVKQLKVVFFNFDALPHDAGKNVMDYIGVGKPIIRLVQ